VTDKASTDIVDDLGPDGTDVFDLDGTNIFDFDVAGLFGLDGTDALYLDGKGVTNDQLAKMVSNGDIPPHITILSLSYNHISDLTPMQSLNSLDELLLINNEISDLAPLKSLTIVPEIFSTTVNTTM